jgi:hypothetical protein
LTLVVARIAAKNPTLKKYQFGIAVKWASIEPMNWVVHSPGRTSLPAFKSPYSGAAARSANHVKSSTANIEENSAPTRIRPGTSPFTPISACRRP